MAPGVSSSLAVAPAPTPLPLLADLSPIPSMGTLPSTSTHSSPRIPLSRKRPNAAALPSIGLIPSKKEKPLLFPSPVLPPAEDFERRKRERFESDSSSQSSVSSQGSSSDESSSTGLLPRHIIDFVLDEPSSASSTPGGATPQEPPAKQLALPHTAAATARECRANAFHDQSVVVEKKEECARVSFISPEKALGPYLESGSLINGYKIIGMGKDASALHLETGEVYNVRLITEKEFQTTVQVAERLEMAHEMCKEEEWDIDELSEAVLPSEAEVVEQDLGEKGRRFILFAPFEYSNLHVMASNTSASSQFGLPEEKVASYFKQIAGLMAFCHQIGIVVRDLKPRKLVFANQSQTKIRLSDVFDVAVCDSVSDDLFTEKFGSPAYIPPEVLAARSNGFAGRPADVWGLGVLTFLLLSGKYPFYDSNPRGVFKKIRRAHVCFPSGLILSRSAREIVHCMLKKRPADRPDAALLAQIPWVTVKDCAATLRERANHMISPQMSSLTSLRRQRPVIIPSSDVLSEQEVPETGLRVTDEGIYVRNTRRGTGAVPPEGEMTVPSPLPRTRFPINEWPYASEMEARLAIESRLPRRDGLSSLPTLSHESIDGRPLTEIARQAAHLRI
ncbi:hypothetical protein PMAYCL1PPCAC_02604 [Pristionchus mayeri]|uniref:Protein kinase domain-containing protein n=1 Tax=Pristionchus mayeri TaxID=1317129 RepID=A0AAN4Z313_9BILA|nr:hypothetical protein PMAYCL1PPCAC_02604 [Pristionchus mayeri]